MSLFFGNCQSSFVPELSVSTNSFNVPSMGDVVTVTIDCNESWILNLDAQELWFVVDVSEGSAGTTTIHITVDANTGALSRSANITVESASGLYQAIEIYQNPQ